MKSKSGKTLNRFAPGTVGFHEIIHASHIAHSLWHHHVMDHRACVGPLKTLAEKACKAMNEFYQTAGRMELASESEAA